MAATPTTRELVNLLARADGVVACRRFADGHGALLVTRRQAVLVELDGPRMSEQTARFLYAFDVAVSRLPITTAVVRDEQDVEKLAATVAGKPQVSAGR